MEEGNEKHLSKTKPLQLPAYAFYRYRRNKEATNDDRDKEAGTGDFSLSVITSNLATEYETELRNFIAKRATKGSLRVDSQGTINILSFGDFDPSGENETETLCYCCLLSHDRDELSNLLAGGNSSHSADEFIVCLLANQDVILDLFRPELDAFSKKLLSLLEPDLLIELDLREELGQLDGLDDKLQPVLEKWYSDCTRYLTHCLHVFEEDIKYLIYAAVTDIKLDVKITDKQLTLDIARFVECCSLSELLSTMKSDSHSDTSSSLSDNTVLVDVGGSGSQLSTENKEETLKITVDTEGKYHFTSCDCTWFCEEWTGALMNGDPENPVFVKQVIDSYKLRAIQDLNNLKRMLKQAETDHYALFRVYIFLTRSGNSSTLLRHAQTEAVNAGSKETLSTLTTLNNFIKESSGRWS